MSKEFSTKQFKKLISFSRGVTKVLFWGTCSLAGLVTLVGVMLLFVDKDWFTLSETMQSTSFDFNSAVEINMNEFMDEDANLKAAALAACFSIPIIFLLVATVLFYLGRILDSLKNNSPFTAENVRSLKIIAWVLIASSVISPSVETFIYTVLIYTTGIEAIDPVFSLNLTTLFVGLLLLILSHIFNYGTYLQQEYDQTL